MTVVNLVPGWACRVSPGMKDTQQETAIEQRARELAEAAPPLTPEERAGLEVLLRRTA